MKIRQSNNIETPDKPLSATARTVFDAVINAPNIDHDRLTAILEEDPEKGTIYIGICYKPPMAAE